MTTLCKPGRRAGPALALGPALAALCALALPWPAAATGLLEVWQAASQNDREPAVARAAQAAAQPRRVQAA